MYLETNEKGEECQQRNRSHTEERNGNKRTERYNNRMFLNSRVFNSRLEKTKDRISEQKDRSMKHTQFEQQREDTL